MKTQNKKIKINIKIGEKVKIISGKYKNQTSIVKKIIYKNNTIILENINIKTKHLKSKQNEEPGQRKQIEGPIHRSNLKKQS
uniref:Large ribosomal subunit protein uL24c n=1 Tax=Sphondylothamnion multifidum TaxID=193186 RepID=A0A4D6X1S2_9FLOR|nr:ribosomal protein L24 [Sphondylothamnion multifidum]